MGQTIAVRSVVESWLVDVSLTRRVSYFILDHIDSIVVTLDSAANVCTYTNFSPYGAVRIQEEEKHLFPQYAQYVQKEKDIETKLLYFEARYLSPQKARFISADPLEFPVVANSLSIPQQANPYAYAWSRPMAFVDVDGRFANAIKWVSNTVLRLGGSETESIRVRNQAADILGRVESTGNVDAALDTSKFYDSAFTPSREELARVRAELLSKSAQFKADSDRIQKTGGFVLPLSDEKVKSLGIRGAIDARIEELSSTIGNLTQQQRGISVLRNELREISKSKEITGLLSFFKLEDAALFGSINLERLPYGSAIKEAEVLKDSLIKLRDGFEAVPIVP